MTLDSTTRYSIGSSWISIWSKGVDGTLTIACQTPQANQCNHRPIHRLRQWRARAIVGATLRRDRSQGAACVLQSLGGAQTAAGCSGPDGTV